MKELLFKATPLLLPAPRILSVRSKPGVFTLPDYEVSAIPGVSGNKARKFASFCGYEALSALCEVPRFPLPARAPRWTDEAAQRGLVSFGGPQSNAMLALARVAKAHGSTLTYHTTPIPAWLRAKPHGNLAAALELGCVRLVEHESVNEYAAAKAAAEGEAAPSFVPQGGAMPEAEPGVAALARHIGSWHYKRRVNAIPARLPGSGGGLDVVLPAGTGTTALFLAR